MKKGKQAKMAGIAHLQQELEQVREALRLSEQRTQEFLRKYDAAEAMAQHWEAVASRYHRECDEARDNAERSTTPCLKARGLSLILRWRQ